MTMQADFAALKEVCRNFSNELTTDVSHHSKLLKNLEGKVYGRICSSPNPHTPPSALSTSQSRKMVFTFGYDGLLSVLQQKNAFDALIELGFLKEYIDFDVNTMKKGSWLVVFLPSQSTQPFSVHAATWVGVLETVRNNYPLLLSEVENHFQELKERPFEEFEKDANFRFIDSLTCFKLGEKTGPPYFDYEYTCSLPRPLHSWQVRAFLYCELRLLELFDGNGRTRMEITNQLGPCEYLCPVVPFSYFDSDSLEMVSLNVVVPP